MKDKTLKHAHTYMFYICIHISSCGILEDLFYDIKICSQDYIFGKIRNISLSKDKKANSHTMREYIGHTCD